MKEDTLLLDVFHAYYDARRHKRNTHSQLEFEFNLEENLVKLYEELRDHTYKVGRSVCFITGTSVKREVFAAHFRDRVVHHLLYNYTAPIFECTFIADSYSCREGMGTLYGVRRFEHHLRSCSNNWTRTCYVLKLDIRGYFMHIVRQKLYNQVMETLRRYAGRKNSRGQYWADALDYSLLEYLMREIIFNDPTLDCEMRGTSKDWEGLPKDKSLFHVPEGRGLPIGNLTSQLFSNVYLNVLDQFVKRTLGEKYYGRYVDDFFIIGTDRKRYLLQKIKSRISNRMERMNRCLSAKKVNRDKLLYISCVANSYMGYMRHMACHRFKNLLVERNTSFHRIGNFKGEKLIFVPFIKGIVPLMK